MRWAEASRTIQTFCLILMIWRDQPCTCSIAPVREPSVAIHVRTRGCGYLFGCLRLLLVRVYLSLGVWFSCGPTPFFTPFLFLGSPQAPELSDWVMCASDECNNRLPVWGIVILMASARPAVQRGCGGFLRLHRRKSCRSSMAPTRVGRGSLLLCSSMASKQTRSEERCCHF